MTTRIVVTRDAYHDSVTLMLASRDAEAVDGVDFAAAVAATPVNLALLAERGFAVPDDVGPNDLVVAIDAVDETGIAAATAAVERALHQGAEARAPTPEAVTPRTIRSAARRNADANVAFVSVPGRHAAYEVAEALESGLNVFCFSDGMTLADEHVLKRRALDAGLLFLGADCGTAVVDGVSFGFANVGRAGPVGVVGASGTGIQQVMCLLDAAGMGVSHALGVGGRDLTAEVGGLMSVHCLELLAGDGATEVIALVSKPPDRTVVEEVAAAAAAAGKPAVLGLLGVRVADLPPMPDGVEVVTSLEGVAATVAGLVGGRVATHDAELESPTTPGEIRGFFCGGSLCYEVAAVTGRGLFIDFGDDQYTVGRAHPMIDPTLRNQHFVHAAGDESVGVIVLDVVLGLGAHPDPAADLGAKIRTAIEERDNLTVIVALCGTDRDPQDLARQAKLISAAGAVVTRNAAHAGRLALAAAGEES